MALSTSRSAAIPSSSAKKMIRALYAGHADRFQEYQTHLQTAFDQVGLHNVDLKDLNVQERGGKDPASFDYIIYAPNGPLKDFGPYNNVKAVFSLWAGVESISNNPTLPHNVPLTRMVDPGLRDGMVEYVVGHTLRYHLEVDKWWQDKRDKKWKDNDELHMPLSSQRAVGILGMGELGSACARVLVESFHFNVLGWSRTSKESRTSTARQGNDSIHNYHGPEGLDHVLQESDILVLLLPNTPRTKHILRQETLQKCKRGVSIINAGRGALIHEDDLLHALDNGIVAGATLDVFETEPLPQEHGFWTYPNVMVTPHIAAKTRSSTACTVIADNMVRAENDKPLLYVVDREAGY